MMKATPRRLHHVGAADVQVALTAADDAPPGVFAIRTYSHPQQGADASNALKRTVAAKESFGDRAITCIHESAPGGCRRSAVDFRGKLRKDLKCCEHSV